MAQPPAFNKANEYAEYAAEHPDAPLDHSALDEDFDAVETTLDAVLENLEEIQRDDGALKNASVHPDSLSTATLALIASTWTPRGLWATLTEYVVGDVVQNSTTSYVCATAHNAGTFATDYAAGKWVILGETFVAEADAITFTAAGNLASTNVQDAIEELDDEKAALAGSASQVFNVSDATDDSHAAAAGQIQKSSLITGLAAGTSDALTCTIASGLTALTDRMHVRIEAASANATTAPTLNLTLGSTATGAKTIKKGAATALALSDIAGGGHMLELVYDSSNDIWLLQNPAFPVGQSSQDLTPDSVQNVGLSFAVGSSALTATLTTASGGTPSSSDSVKAAMRSSTASAGTWNTREATSGISLTVPSSATLGHVSAQPSLLNWYFIDNAGTLELAVSTRFFGHSGIVSTTAISASATSAVVMYSTSTRSNVPFTWIGSTFDTQSTAGTWASVPSLATLARGREFALQQLIGNGRLLNGRITYAVAGSALTIALKTDANADPSATDPVLVAFRSATAANDDFVVIPVTAALSVVVPDTATIGTANDIAFRLWVVAFNDAGAVRLGVINCLSGTNIYPLAGWGIASATQVGTGSDSAHVFYSNGAAVTSKAYTVLSYATWESGLAAAGTWSAGPTRAQLVGHAVALPGQVVQTAHSASGTLATGTTQLPLDNTIPQNTEGDEYMTQAITPTSAANVLDIQHEGNYAFSDTGGSLTAALFQDSTAGALAAKHFSRNAAADSVAGGSLRHRMRAGTTSATTLKIRAGSSAAGTTTFNGQAETQTYGGVGASVLSVSELMA